MLPGALHWIYINIFSQLTLKQKSLLKRRNIIVQAIFWCSVPTLIDTLLNTTYGPTETCDTGQQMPYFDSCQLIIRQIKARWHTIKFW